MTDTQYPITFCFKVGLLMLFILRGTSPVSDVITLTIPTKAYPGETIRLNCSTSLSGVTYKWLIGNSTISNSATFDYTFPKIIYVETKSFTCQVLMGMNVVGQKLQEVKIAFVNIITFDIRTQDLNNLDKVVIQCFPSTTVSGQVDTTWYFNDMAIVVPATGYQIVEHTLTIIATDPVRSGVYVCSATLDGMASTKKSLSTTVQIYSPAQVSLEQPSEGDVFNLLENSLFKITCNITGLETPRVHWLVNDRIPDNTSVTVLSDITEGGE